MFIRSLNYDNCRLYYVVSIKRPCVKSPRILPLFASLTCSQKETAEFHALSLRTIAAIRLFERENSPLRWPATRSRLCSTHAGHSASVWRAVSHGLAIAVVAPRRWLLADQTQVISETSLPSDHLRQSV
ncbi:unnamed protein product [Arctia plantaginis]|uniref:Uncharacterized protein n=1 Tax=Arctia plantaginis TaxID=874455 RepID=A0A8S1BRA7_ARCPL|nr:unnamed protein product [Arctia plantaginis]